ncbi:DNA replication protein [Rosenbergiella australiborealis]|uniref:DNA replication protein n=1 Tax=Rosenbergiella australiborealis TaxID=1544696 RepID=A0ABS5T361_9GAMM|nr:replication protein P [Rosenbergiella australiborealis]MBT0726802.1 DNA replication protein [Rosenbergiella australiborealis]
MRNLNAAIARRDGKALAAMATPEPPKKPVSQQAVQVFNELFRQLKAAFPALMMSIKTQEDLDELRRQWVMAFVENGIYSIGQVNAGMKIARQQEVPFLPSPGQFISWCHQEEFRTAGLPNEEELYLIVMKYCSQRGLYDCAENYPWQSNAEYWMVTTLYDQMRALNLSEAELKKRCRKQLHSMVQRLNADETIPAPRKQIPVLHIPSTKETAKSHIAQIRRRFGLRRG